ncbi:MAG: hypothetical protein GX638_18695 [Crenarchaeota archaeon]|nr:hypothetical protein [Thermoproteota archaeon]
MAIPSSWKEVKLDRIVSLRKTTKNFVIETDDIRYAIKCLKDVKYKEVYFYRSDNRRVEGVDPYYKILATLN